MEVCQAPLRLALHSIVLNKNDGDAHKLAARPPHTYFHRQTDVVNYFRPKIFKQGQAALCKTQQVVDEAQRHFIC